MDSSPDKLWLERLNKMYKTSSNELRSDGMHACGFNATNRLFGGQTVAQSFLAFKTLYPDTVVVRLDTNFIAPGDINIPLDYSINASTVPHGYAKVEIKQNNKIIALANVRFTKKVNVPLDQLFLKHPDLFPAHVGPPLSYDQLIREETIKVFTDKPTEVDQPLFEVRPINSGKFLFYNDVFEPAAVWARANPKLKSSQFQRDGVPHPLVIPMVMTDFLIFHPSISIYNHFEQLHLAMTGGSLNHKMTIHCDNNDIDPFGFFLFQIKCSTVSRQCSIIDGQLFDQSKRLVLTYRQQNYNSP